MPRPNDGAVPRSTPHHVMRWVVADPDIGLSTQSDSMGPNPARRQRLVRHAPGQCPYLEVQLGGKLIHAQEIAWHDERVMIRYPVSITDQHHFSRPVICWVDREQTRRIARENSRWNDPGDDIDWHEIEDESLLPPPFSP